MVPTAELRKLPKDHQPMSVVEADADGAFDVADAPSAAPEPRANDDAAPDPAALKARGDKLRIYTSSMRRALQTAQPLAT